MPRDTNQLAKYVVDVATGTASRSAAPRERECEKNPAAVALGRLGGAKGGAARARSLSKKRRAEIAMKAAKARWRKGNQTK